MISAPGKLVLLGDYAVLEDGTAMVAAVNRRARGSIVPSKAPSSGLVRAVYDLASPLSFDPSREGVEIDTSNFRDTEGRKLGIGSSAAVATVAAALARGRGGPETLALALDAHRKATGGGSGVDVASSFHGGIIAAKRQPSAVRLLPVGLPGLHLFTLFTGESASTSELVRACRAAATWREHASHLARLADEGIEAWSSGDAARFLRVVSQYGNAMDTLGRDAGVPVVTESIRAAMRLATEGGGAAKPSGAGGGDVVIGFSSDPELGRQIAAETGLVSVELVVDPLGLSFERA